MIINVYINQTKLNIYSDALIYKCIHINKLGLALQMCVV